MVKKNISLISFISIFLVPNQTSSDFTSAINYSCATNEKRITLESPEHSTVCSYKKNVVPSIVYDLWINPDHAVKILSMLSHRPKMQTDRRIKETVPSPVSDPKTTP